MIFNSIFFSALAAILQVIVTYSLGFCEVDLIALSILMLVPATVLAVVLDGAYSNYNRMVV